MGIHFNFIAHTERKLRQFYNQFISPERAFVKLIRSITGFVPVYPDLYRMAFRHSSALNTKNNPAESNERLEYLGDAILGAIVGEYLYRKYPLRTEGFLTEMRSRIVSRASLNELGITLGFDALLEFNRKSNGYNKSIYGNTVEAFIGALYIDQGYEATRKFITRRILNHFINVSVLEVQDLNFKSRLMEYAQKMKLEPVVYEVVEGGTEHIRRFTVSCKVGSVIGYGTDMRKKDAEQKASEDALLQLEELTNPNPKIEHKNAGAR
jgi:ribonuclease-3